MQEVLRLEGDGHSLHRHLIPWRWVVADICPHSKCHRLGLEEAHREDDNQRIERQCDAKLPDWGGDYMEVCLVNYSLKVTSNGLCSFLLWMQNYTIKNLKIHPSQGGGYIGE